MKTKPGLILTALGVALFLLAGCTPSHDAEFLSLVNSRSYFDPVPDEMLLEAGHGVCDTLDRGATLSSVLMEVAISDLDPYEGGWLVGAAVSKLCPEHLP